MHCPRRFPRLPLLVSVIVIAFSLYLQAFAFASEVEHQVKPPQSIKTANLSETVTIGNKVYDVPFPWTGNRLPKTTFSPSEFKQVPSKHCKNGAKIYVLAKVYKPLLAMFNAALKDGIHLQVESGYRSEAYQKRIFSRKLAEGRTFEDIVRYVAPPGYSQHMLGIALDFSPSNWRFASTPEYQWLKDNGARFYFEEVYSEYNKMQMPWEAWHWSYLGAD